MVNFAEIRKHILAGEGEGDGEETLTEDIGGNNIEPTTPPAAWRKELDSFNTSAPLSLGAGLLGAAAYDGIANREGTPIFDGTWKTLILLTGGLLFGLGVGRLQRGTSAQNEAESYESIILKAEQEAHEIEEEKQEKEEQQKEAKQAESNLLYNHESFGLTTSSNGLMGFGEYGSAVGQQGISYRYMG